ncbi:uncharacterized protein si:ch211-22i13.2 [Polypterus senegalus]|uniref:uncharacterized protein si:ch211-22i13.2 n=1 Tax=Polypterus senegalus TaxID=55291 RepID=UPI0019637C4A|nr:uncharacterized protein si:ch211-22i13.2 [Polypterus senegalus]
MTFCGITNFSCCCLLQKMKKEKKHKKKKKGKKAKQEGSGPVQISKFLNEKKKNEYSMITGKKIKMKVKKTKMDKERDKNRAELLDFLNSTLKFLREHFKILAH